MAFSGRTHFCRPAVVRRHSTRRKISTFSTDGAVTHTSSASFGNALSSFSVVGGVVTALGTTAVCLVTFSWHVSSLYGKLLTEVSIIKEKVSSLEEGHKQATRCTDLRFEKLDVKIDRLASKMEATVDKHDARFASLEGKFVSLEGKFNVLILAFIVSTAIVYQRTQK